MDTSTSQPRAVGQTAHTPTPWRVNLDSVISESGLHICAVDGYGMTGEQNAANRAFIVTACNSHAALVKALTGAEKALTKALPHCPADTDAHFVGEWLGEVRAALAAAKEGQ